MNKFKLTNPDKILFPKEKLTKLDIFNYYLEINNLMLPYIENRLLSVIRCHDGINKEVFIKKHPSNDREYVNIILDENEEYFYINKDYQLLYQIQNGTLEFHTTSLPIKNKGTSIMIFDLDPDEKLPLNKLKAAVLLIKSLLDDLNLVSFLKTSGGKGFHIFIPFKKVKNSDKFYEFSKKIALIAETKWPDVFTTNLKKEKRKNKIFIDYLRNNKKSTCVAPYSLRIREKAPISMPISWDKLKEIKPNEVTIKNYKKYLDNSWANFFNIDQNLNYK